MKNISLLFIMMTALFLWCLRSQAQSASTSTYQVGTRNYNVQKTDDFGMGIKWGTLTGATAKYWTNDNEAWDLTVAFENGNTAVGADYLWHFRSLLSDLVGSKKVSSFVPYAGAGLISAIGSHTQFFNRDTENFGLAARAPIGIEFLPPTITSLGIFAEVGLGFGFVPTTYTFISSDLGARYYF